MAEHRAGRVGAGGRPCAPLSPRRILLARRPFGAFDRAAGAV